MVEWLGLREAALRPVDFGQVGKSEAQRPGPVQKDCQFSHRDRLQKERFRFRVATLLNVHHAEAVKKTCQLGVLRVQALFP